MKPEDQKCWPLNGFISCYSKLLMFIIKPSECKSESQNYLILPQEYNMYGSPTGSSPAVQEQGRAHHRRKRPAFGAPQETDGDVSDPAPAGERPVCTGLTQQSSAALGLIVRHSWLIFARVSHLFRHLITIMPIIMCQHGCGSAVPSPRWVWDLPSTSSEFVGRQTDFSTFLSEERYFLVPAMASRGRR